MPSRSSLLGRIVYWLSIGVLFTSSVVLIVFFYWSFAPVNILKVQVTPIPVEKPVVKAGEVQILVFSFCKYQNITGYVQSSLVSRKIVILLPGYTDSLKPGCSVNLRVPLVTPNIRVSDTYHFHYVITYWINPIQSKIVIFNSRPFVIIGQ